MGPCGGGWYRFTGRAEGDFAPASCGVEQRRSALAPGRWTWLRQVHGADVVVVEAPGAGAGTVADASTTTTTIAAPPPPPADGEAVARIVIPKIGVDKIVVSGVGRRDLQK
ncbi:MAG TPA: hypothetical protein VNT56_08895, partial [Acidimicrobiales bacterium]|nr:hypothetical protein [Acidimicrobiales bacterium]